MGLEKTKKIPKLYVLKHPETGDIRYVGITIRSLNERLSGHLCDIRLRPNLNTHKTNWIKSLQKGGMLPKIELVETFDCLEKCKQAEMDYIKQYKEEYRLINATIGGDHLGERSHSRESILKKEATRSISQYNIFGEYLRSFEITEDAARFLGISSASKITMCCRGLRPHSHGYIWRYEGDELGDISEINKNSLSFNKIVQYSLEGELIAMYSSYLEASKQVGDGSKGGNIASAATGRQRTCKGFLWRLEPDFEYLDENLVFQEDVVTIRKKKKRPGKKVNLYDLDKNFVATYESISDACRAVYGNRHRHKQVTKCCDEGNFSIYDGRIWEYCPAEE